MKLIYDEQSLVDNQMYKYDQYLHARINKYTGSGRTLVIYYNINDQHTTDSFGMNDIYQFIGKESPLRYDKIVNFPLLDFSPLTPQESNASQTSVRNYALNGDAYVIPGTIMPKENDMFIVKHLNMNNLFRVTSVTQDGLNTDGSYKITYELYSTDNSAIENLNRQVVKECVTDLQTVGGSDLTPIIGRDDYNHRSRLIKMVNDMIENYISRFYDHKHNCLIYKRAGESLFDPCGNLFMAKHGLLIDDNSNENIVLNPDKLRIHDIDFLYQKSPFKWIERDAPLRYLDSFKYHINKSYNYPDSSFVRFGDNDIDIMIPNDPWCVSPECEQYFPDEVVSIFDNEADIRTCKECDCRCCPQRSICCRHIKCQRYDYVSMIHDFIYGKITSMKDLSLYTGDQLFDNYDSKELYLWTPIIIYIIKKILTMKE